MTIRLSKAAMVLAMAFFATLVAFGNITDYATNFAFVHHVFLMDTTFPGNGIMYRAIDTEWVHHAGYIGIMLSGAFPMVWLMNRFLQKPMAAVGSRLGLSPAGTTGLLAASANILAMFRLIADMPPRDKVLVIAFAVCGAFMFGDHLAFSANFQPTIILPLLLGKLIGGIAGFAFAAILTRLQPQLDTATR